MGVRRAAPRDFAEIARIWTAEIAGSTASWKTEPMGSEAVAAWARERGRAGHPVLVEAEAPVLRGFGSYGPFRRGEGYALTVEHSLYVDAAHRRKGVGAALLSALISEARAAGLTRMMGGISADQAASLALHARFGFREVGRLPGVGRKFGRPLDLVLVMLELDRTERTGD